MTIALWLFSALAGLALIDRFSDTDFFLGVFSSIVGIACYAALVVLSGRSARLLQTVSAIVGCSALIFFAFVAEYVLFTPFLGPPTAGLVATLILFWSVPVEGHIISRAIDRHWYVGILIAVGVFCLQYLLNAALTAPY